MIRSLPLLVFLAPLALAQAPPEVPPVVSELPGGQPVSQPIQPVLPEAEVIPPPRPVVVSEQPVAPKQAHWLSLDYTMAWTQGVNLPTLATANLTGMPVLGDPNTVRLLGGRQSRGMIEGMRVVAGRWNSDNSGWGREIAYHFLGTSTDRQILGGGGLQGEALLGRPLFNPRTRAEDVVLISHPNMLGELEVNQSMRVQGWEAVVLRELYANEWARVSALAGYRYFQVHEGLRLDQRSEYFGQPVVGTGVATYRTATADQIDAHNRFHGGTLGLRTQLDYGGFFAQLDTKVSIGRTTEVVRISGQTVSTIVSPGGTTISHFPNGVYGQPSNSGRSARGVFAVLPEANLRLGYAFTDRARLFVGYQFSFLSDVVRAADQIDRVVDLAQTAGSSFGRPALPFARTDFWVQGVTLGLEWRY
jgi:hypothetical protein